jgi:hypothetical protein
MRCRSRAILWSTPSGRPSPKRPPTHRSRPSRSTRSREVYRP